mmetsp:Transcript_37388/g.90876  ORF Transcript_37388/g.90876 Transcript_37388/m.90876 type:complete len:227 (+) Transcript_37388:612-1292(+)
MSKIARTTMAIEKRTQRMKMVKWTGSRYHLNWFLFLLFVVVDLLSSSRSSNFTVSLSIESIILIFAARSASDESSSPLIVGVSDSNGHMAAPIHFPSIIMLLVVVQPPPFSSLLPAPPTAERTAAAADDDNFVMSSDAPTQQRSNGANSRSNILMCSCSCCCGVCASTSSPSTATTTAVVILLVVSSSFVDVAAVVMHRRSSLLLTFVVMDVAVVDVFSIVLFFFL